MHKKNQPKKTCIVCNRSFQWRKKWANCWKEVRYCSKKCQQNRKRLVHE
ncbi:MAG: DUF2256 domain-containing protein [Pontiellaceae bacterium]